MPGPTVTFHKLGARLRLEVEAGADDSAEGELVLIGRKFLTVRLDGGELVDRIWPSWVRVAPL